MFNRVKSLINFLTFITLISFFNVNVHAFFSQEQLRTHLRWKLSAANNQINIRKKSKQAIIETLDSELFDSLQKRISTLEKNKNYHSEIIFKKSNVIGNPHKIVVKFPNRGIELFNFYKKDNGEHILDYWINNDIVSTKTAAVVKKRPVKKVSKKAKKKIVPKKIVQSTPEQRKQRIQNAFKLVQENFRSNDKKADMRDFRYGSAFIWDYDALIPHLEKTINLSVKAPDYFYKVKDRSILADSKEAHMQLSINFYNKSKWGLMTRSVKLYEEKYGRDKNAPVNDFMNAVSLIKNTIKPILTPKYEANEDDEEITKTFSNKGVLNSAYNLLGRALQNTEDLLLKKAILKYLIQERIDSKDFIKSLEYAKNLYVTATEEFDDENIVYSSRVILHSLAKLSQLSKIEDFLENKAVKRVLSPQEGMAYKSFVMLERKEYKPLIKQFEKERMSLVRPIHSSILFNVGEAYFRSSKYIQTNALMGEFLAQYSEYDFAGFARLRLALSHDLLGKSTDSIKKLYTNAIDKTANLKARAEAKIRYVGFNVARSFKLKDELQPLTVFLDLSDEERRNLDNELKRLLWLTRLRTMIVFGEYKNALAYLSSLPLDSMSLIDKKVFLGDGAEIVLGVAQKLYYEDNFSGVVKTWEIYKEKYEQKVAKNPYLQYMVAESFLNLGLFKSFDRAYDSLAKLKNIKKRSYPLWIKATKDIKLQNYLVELRIKKYLYNENYDGLAKFLKSQKGNKDINYNYYKGIVSYQKRDYTASVESFEKLLASSQSKNKLRFSESIRMIDHYLEALFQTVESPKFIKNATALVGDLRRSESKRVSGLVEKAEYLLIESYYSAKNTNYKVISERSKEFLDSHKESVKKDRVSYIHGVALIKQDMKKAGKEVLETLINNENTPEYLKGLARSELATLKLEEITL